MKSRSGRQDRRYCGSHLHVRRQDALHMLMRWFPDRIVECCTKFSSTLERGSGIEGCVCGCRTNGVGARFQNRNHSPDSPAKPQLQLPCCRLPPAACTPHPPSAFPRPPTLFFSLFRSRFRFCPRPPPTRLPGCTDTTTPPVPILQLLFTSGFSSRRSRIGIIHGQTMGQCKVPWLTWQTGIHPGSRNL